MSQNKRRGRPPQSQQFTPVDQEKIDNQEDIQNKFENKEKSDNMENETESVNSLQAARERRKARRKGRAPGPNSLKLETSQIEGYRLRWVNDDQDRVKRLIDDGWDVVKKSEVTAYSSDDGDNISQVTGAGNGRSILMKQPEEFYQEDLVIKRKAIGDRSAGLKRASEGKDALGKSHAYIPRGTNSEFEL